MWGQSVPMVEQEIIITESRWPIARAGMGLVILPAGAIFCLFAYKAIADSLESIFLASFLSALIAVIFGLFFCWTLSRISNEGGVITVIRSIDRVQFLEKDIVATRVFSIGQITGAVQRLSCGTGNFRCSYILSRWITPTQVISTPPLLL